MFSRKGAEAEPTTVAACGSCGWSERRGFSPGDALFAESGCPSCGGAARIEKIFGAGRP